MSLAVVVTYRVRGVDSRGLSWGGEGGSIGTTTRKRRGLRVHICISS